MNLQTIKTYLKSHRSEIVFYTGFTIALLILGMVTTILMSTSTIVTVGIFACLLYGVGYIVGGLLVLHTKKQTALSNGIGCLAPLFGYIGYIMAVALSLSSWLVALVTIVLVSSLLHQTYKEVIKSNKFEPTPISETELAQLASKVTTSSTVYFVVTLVLNIVIRALPFIVFLLFV